jgi:putative Mn2+ efflux pump MntP
MPVVGWALSFSFADLVNSAAPWIGFALLAVVGGHMIKESFDDDHGVEGVTVGLVALLPLALATSIDIAVVGVSFGFLEVDIVPAVLLIGGIVFVLALAAVVLGAKLGERLGKWATLAGGVVLVLIGLRILVEHLWF